MKLKAAFLTAALALAALASPGVSFARGHSHHDAPSFPMKADEYRALMEKRIDGVRATIDKKLDRRGVSADRKKAIHKIFDESSQDLRAEIARATADGTVTQAEATKVKALTMGLRAKVRERLRAEKTGHDGRHAEPPAKKAKAAPAEKPTPSKKADAAKEPEKTAKTKPAKKPAKKAAGPTKQAKTASAKKPKKKAAAEPGANL